MPLGTKLAGMFKTIARITTRSPTSPRRPAGFDLTQAGWARRLEEWIHQVEVLDIEIHGLERQILGCRTAPQHRAAGTQQPSAADRAVEGGAGLPARQVHEPRAVSVPAERDGGAPLPDVRAGAARGASGRTRLQLRARIYEPARSFRANPGTRSTKDCWPATASSWRCARWRRRTSTPTCASTS